MIFYRKRLYSYWICTLLLIHLCSYCGLIDINFGLLKPHYTFQCIYNLNFKYIAMTALILILNGFDVCYYFSLLCFLVFQGQHLTRWSFWCPWRSVGMAGVHSFLGGLHIFGQRRAGQQNSFQEKPSFAKEKTAGESPAVSRGSVAPGGRRVKGEGKIKKRWWYPGCVGWRVHPWADGPANPLPIFSGSPAPVRFPQR